MCWLVGSVVGVWLYGRVHGVRCCDRTAMVAVAKTETIRLRVAASSVAKAAGKQILKPLKTLSTSPAY